MLTITSVTLTEPWTLSTVMVWAVNIIFLTLSPRVGRVMSERRRPSCYLFVVLLFSQPLDLGVVDGQVPAVSVAQLVAAAAEQSLPLGWHRLQGGQHRPAALRTTGLTGHIHRTAVIQVPDRTLVETGREKVLQYTNEELAGGKSEGWCRKASFLRAWLNHISLKNSWSWEAHKSSI